MVTPSFIVVDPSLKDFIGHHFAYDNSVAAAAADAGFAPVVVGHREVASGVTGLMRVTPAFRRDIWGFHPLAARWVGRPGRLGERARALDNRLCARDFWVDLTRALARIEIAPGSVILAHMITQKHLPAFAHGLRRVFAGGAGRTVILLLRYQAAFYDNPECARAFRRLEALAKAGHAIRLASDSGRLADQIGALTMLPVEVLPIPHTPPAEPDASHARHGRPLRFASLGNARDEKGYLEILQAIRILQMEPDGLAGLEFWLQSNHPAPDIRAAIEAFSRNQPPEVSLIHEGMDEATYHEALAAADVVLVPYWRSIYEARTSGVLLEAMAAGKPVIASQDCWMSDELALHGAGILIPDQDPMELAAAIRRMAKDHATLAARAMADRGAVLARHSAAALVAQCSAPPPASSPRRPPRRLAVFYPWDDVQENRGGASLRVNMLLDMLAPLVGRVDVLQQGGRPPTQRGDNVFIESAGRADWHKWFQRLVWLATWPFLGRSGRGQELLLWYHLERLPALRFHRKVDAMVAAADAVLLEYSFHAPIVLAAARRHGKPVILSQYDVVSGQILASAAVRNLVLWLEATGLRGATYAFTVSKSDQAVFEAKNVSTQVVPNPVDLRRSVVPLPLEPRRILREAYGIALPEAPIALFVGSNYPPNVAAGQHVRRLSRACPGVTFVVAGGCHQPMEEKNFRALGIIDEAALIALYRAALLVVVPLESGSGSSLKTVEAMAAGVPVLGTPVAFRGVGGIHDVNCFIEADLMQWPGRIARLLADPALAARVGEAGREVAQKLDYRIVFRAYTEALNLRPDESRADAAMSALEASLMEQIRSAAMARGAKDLLADLPPGDVEEDAPDRTCPPQLRLHPVLHEAVCQALARGQLQLELARHLMTLDIGEAGDLPLPAALDTLELELARLTNAAHQTDIGPGQPAAGTPGC